MGDLRHRVGGDYMGQQVFKLTFLSCKLCELQVAHSHLENNNNKKKNGLKILNITRCGGFSCLAGSFNCCFVGGRREIKQCFGALSISPSNCCQITFN